MADTPNQTSGALTDPMDRRSALKKAAAAGAIVWTSPMILSKTALAVGGGSPQCQPTISVSCERYNCQQGQKWMPGIKVTVTPCPCSTTTPPQLPKVCVRLSNITNSKGDTTVTYGEPTQCGPTSVSGVPDNVLVTGNWECVESSLLTNGFQIFFGSTRNAQGAIDEIGDGTIISFRLDVWAGDCPTEVIPTDKAYRCESYDVSLMWLQGGGGVQQGGEVVCNSTAFGGICPTCGISDVANDPGCAGQVTSPCGTC